MHTEGRGGEGGKVGFVGRSGNESRSHPMSAASMEKHGGAARRPAAARAVSRAHTTPTPVVPGGAHARARARAAPCRAGEDRSVPRHQRIDGAHGGCLLGGRRRLHAICLRPGRMCQPPTRQPPPPSPRACPPSPSTPTVRRLQSPHSPAPTPGPPHLLRTYAPSQNGSCVRLRLCPSLQPRKQSSG